MRVAAERERHLTYCTNVHPGESWAQVRQNLERYVVPVRERVAPHEPFGLGLRLSGRAARELSTDAGLEELHGFLAEHDLYVFTLNGFPHGAFHGQPVKEEVYRPDWLEEERLDYTNRLAELLAALLPPDLEGTISTVPGAFAARARKSEDGARIAAQLARHVLHLLRLRDATGRKIALALEPEPCCHLETVAEGVAFLETHLFGSAGVDVLAPEAGISRTAAERALREHVGLCFDTCHMAVEFEEPAGALAEVERAGVRLLKVQVSSGLRVKLGAGEDEAVLRDLERFADDVYLHQVVERGARGDLRRYLDLPQALSALGRPQEPREWRVHFHVPLFRARLGRFESTQAYATEALRLLRNGSDCKHFEVETYTWDVLPDEYRAGGIVEAVAREIEWTRARLADVGSIAAPA